MFLNLTAEFFNYTMDNNRAGSLRHSDPRGTIYIRGNPGPQADPVQLIGRLYPSSRGFSCSTYSENAIVAAQEAISDIRV